MSETTVCDSKNCVTCADEGVPMTVVRVDPERALALCERGGGARASVEIALVEPVAPGEVLLVHAGTAIARLGAPGASPAGRAG